MGSMSSRSEDCHGEMDEDLVQPVIKGGRYFNPFETYEGRTFLQQIKFFRTPDQSRIPWAHLKDLDQTLPVKVPDYKKLNAPPADKVQVTWIGHATVLVQFDGFTVLTDPVWGRICGPMGKFGPKRYRDPPCQIKELPSIDAVIISHTHYDHLDRKAVAELHKTHGASICWFVGAGQKEWMCSVGCDNVVELSWWQENKLVKDGKTFTFACTPSQHSCRRTLLDHNKSLWCSWAVQGPRHSFYFAGDTGYCSAFKQIGQKYGPFSLAAIPIGGYHPRWFVKPEHVDPEEALQIHEDVRAQQSVGIHWGTFPMTYEYYLEPKLKLQSLLKEKGLDPDMFITVHHGDVVTIDEPKTSS